MRSKVGSLCIFLGTALILGALSLFLYNIREASEAEQSVSDLLPQVMEQIKNFTKNDTELN